MSLGAASRLRLSRIARLLLPLLALPAMLAWSPTPASATTTASLSISVQVCATAPMCYWEYDADWASTVPVPSGANVFWRVSITNTGNVPLTNIVTNDANTNCAGGVTAGPLQPGAVTAYSCQSDGVTQPTTNTASATGTPPTGPAVTSSTSSASVTITSNTVDPNANISALVQVCTLAVGPSCDPGNEADWATSSTVYNTEIWWRIVITNTGTDPLTDLYVTSSLPPSEADCAGTVISSLAPGAVYDYVCQLNNVIPPTTVTQTITASGDPPTGPFITSPSSSATAQVDPSTPVPGAGISALLQICTLSNQAACDPTNAADWASSATLNQPVARWRVVITNTGTVPLTDIYGTDTLAQTDCGGLVTSSLAAGATTEYECQTNNVIQTTTNTATATGDPPTGAPVTSSPSSSTAVVDGYVQGTSFVTGGLVTSLTVTLNGPVNAGDLLVGWVAEYNAAGQVTVSDNVNGAWTRSPASETFGGTGDIALLYRPDTQASPSGLTITITAPAGAYLQGSIAEYTGVAASSPLDQFSVAEGNGTTVSTGPTASVPAGELAYSALLTSGNPGTVTPGNSQGVTFWPRAATASDSAYEQDIVSANAGPQTTAATLGTATGWYAVVATFKTTPDVPASVPTGLVTTSDTASSVGLSWAPSSDAAGYTVYRNGTELGTTTSSGYTDSTVSPSTTYQYTVDAFNAEDTHSAQSTALPVTTPAVSAGAPSVPTGLAMTSDTASSVGLSWTPSTGAAGYTVYRNGSALGTTTSPSYTDSTVSPSTPYQYTVDALNAVNTHSAQSTALPVTTPSGGGSGGGGSGGGGSGGGGSGMGGGGGSGGQGGVSGTAPHGYWLVGSDGGIFNFGSAQFYGSTGSMHLQRPVVGIVPTADRGGYWLDASDGGVFSFGDTQFYGSIPGLGLHPAGSGLPNSLNAPIVGMVPSIDDRGYFMVASDGGVFAFGDAHFAGSCPGIGGCAGSAVAVMPDASGKGYWVVTKTGSVYTFGDAPYFGAPGHGTVTSAVATPDGKGYWILLSDGEVFGYGDATNLGSPSPANFSVLNQATAIFATSGGAGYWVSSALGAVFNFGDAPSDGGMSGTHLNGSIIAATGY